MKEKEFKPIIDREKQEGDVNQYFSKHLELLVDLVNYGSNLIPRVFTSSERKLEDIIVIGVLLKQVILMIDAVEVLISKCAVGAANLEARAAFEASLYIDWILKEETEKKAKYYYVSNLRNQRLWALRVKIGTPEREVFSEAFKQIEKHIVKTADLEDLEKRADEELGKIDTFLAKASWNEISNEFEGKKNKRTGAEYDWYKLLGIKTVRRLADSVGRLGEYDLFYSRSSEVMHGTSYRDHIQFGKGTVIFEPIRHLKDVHFVLRFVTLAAIASYISILKHYRYDELSHFKRKYLQDWRDTFLNIPSITYTLHKYKD